MIKSIKNNKIVIYVIALMLVTAGYLNYTANDSIIASSEEVYNENLADIGDATLVSNNEVIDSDDENINGNISEEFTNTIEENSEETNQNMIDSNSIITTSNAVSTDYFVNSKLERDTMYSQMIETYQNIINSTTISEEQRSIATQEITNINNLQNQIMICENLLTTKGFDNNIVFINGDSVSVVVENNGDLATEQVAQIQNIVSREIGAQVENISISVK